MNAKNQRTTATPAENAGNAPQNAERRKGGQITGESAIPPAKATETAICNLSALRQIMDAETWDRIFHKVEEPPRDAADIEERQKAFEIVDCLEALNETAPDSRSPYTSGEIMQAIETEYGLGGEAALVDVLRVYSAVYPTDRRTIFQIAEVAGHIRRTRAMESFREHIRQLDAPGK